MTMTELPSEKLNAREKECLAARLLGFDGPTIAAIFNLALSTVKNALSSAAGKLGTKGQGSATTAERAKELGFVTEADMAAVRELAVAPAAEENAEGTARSATEEENIEVCTV